MKPKAASPHAAPVVVVAAAAVQAVAAAAQPLAVVAAVQLTAAVVARPSRAPTPATQPLARHAKRNTLRVSHVTSNRACRASHARIPAMTLTTSSQPAMLPQASLHPVNLPADATATTAAVATVPVVAAAVARVALVAGATGLVGRAVLDRLLADKRYTAVHCVGRRAAALQHPKLTQHVARLDADWQCPAVDDVFIALGTTIQTAGSRAAFRAVDYEAVLAVARSAQASGATRLAVVSAMGASTKARVFYNRVKGDMEAAVGAMAWPVLLIVRPSLLAGDRRTLHQTARPGEQFGLRVFAWLRPLIPRDYQSVHAEQVAQAMVTQLPSLAPGVHVMRSGELQPA